MDTTSHSHSRSMRKVWIGVAVVIVVGSWFYTAIQPPPPRLCGSEGGPPVTATRIRLRDGRFLAYAETGVPRDRARFKIVFCHGFSGSRLDAMPASPELIEELGVYMVAYDRAGYGESDPNPRRSLKSEVSDIEELTDALELKPKFYLIGFSLGGHAVWASLKYIPGRGIDVVRNRIKMFAQQKVTLPPGRHKIIILDEADSMTSGAQQALRRTMEIYSNTTRFALACNTSSKIIEPIQSRCALVRFARLSDQEILGRLMVVVASEKVPYVPEGLEAIIFTADGDMRQALNNLQATFSGFRFVNQENVFKVCDQPHPLHVKNMVRNVLEGKFDDACAGLKQLYDLGYSPTDIITTLFRIIKNYDMAEYLKLEFLKETGSAHMRICDGVGSLLQLSGLLAKFALARETAKAV